MPYAKKAGHHMGTKYTMGIGGEMSEQVAKRIANVRFTSYHTLFY